MSTARRSEPDLAESGGGTLGELLYRDSAKNRVPEKDWTALIVRMATGDHAALQALYERGHSLVFTLMMRMTNNRATAEELTVDVFHDLWRRAPAYDPAGGTVIGWMMNQARSRAIDRLRHEQRKKRLQPQADRELPEAAQSDGHLALEIQQEGRLLQVALGVLSPPERQAIEAAFFSELSYSEVAATLNEPVGTIKTRIRSGLDKLRQALAPRGGLP